jgi:DNA-binding NarL/FixJ family response regulator
VLDIAMPRTTGLQAARELTRRSPELPMLMLSMYDNEQYLIETFKAGAAGYVLESVADRDLVEACRAAVRGDPVPERVLTAREEEVLKLIAEGYSARQVAETLFISTKTVDRHRANILQKLHLRDRLDLARYAIRSGLFEL